MGKNKEEDDQREERRGVYQLLAILSLVIIVLLVFLFLIPSNHREDSRYVPKEEPSVPCVGCDSDVHGCMGSAGYQWCEPKQKCIRLWEENCMPNGFISEVRARQLAEEMVKDDIQYINYGGYDLKEVSSEQVPLHFNKFRFTYTFRVNSSAPKGVCGYEAIYEVAGESDISAQISDMTECGPVTTSSGAGGGDTSEVCTTEEVLMGNKCVCTTDECCWKYHNMFYTNCIGHWQLKKEAIDNISLECEYVCDDHVENPCGGGVLIKACPSPPMMVTCDILTDIHICKKVTWEWKPYLKGICELKDDYTKPNRTIGQKLYQRYADVWCEK